MSAASHFTPLVTDSRTTYWLGVLAVIALLEINALTGDKGPAKQPLEKIPGVITTGFVVWAVVYGLVQFCLSA